MIQGFIALITVIIVAAITMVVGIGVSLLSISEANIGLGTHQSSQAYYMANLCAEHALMRLKEDVSYTGDETMNNEMGSCTIFPVEGNWVIEVQGVSSNFVSKIRIVISQVDPSMVINSWEEVADF